MSETVLSLDANIPTVLELPGSRMRQPGDRAPDDPEKIHRASQQFEALLIAQILKTAHDDSEGWLGTGDDQAAGSAMAIAEEQFAEALSMRGGVGLAGLIEKGLTRSRNVPGR